MNSEPSLRGPSGAASSLRVSAVLPTYNRAGLLVRCLESLEAQTLDRDAYEVIVVDDGSTDNTSEVSSAVVERAKMRMVYVRGSHGGPATARNLGIGRARGEIVAFIDDDCAAASDWLERLLAALINEQVVGVEGKVVRHPDCTPFTHFVENLNGGLFLTANMAYRRDVLEAAGGFHQDYRLAAAEDWDLAFRIMERGGEIRFCPEAVVVHAPVPIEGRDFIEIARERRSAAMLYQRFPRRWEATTGRTMRRSFAEGIFTGPFVEARKWRRYFSTHRSALPPFLWWQALASARLLVEYVRLRHVGLV